jgi:hypothetical protein
VTSDATGGASTTGSGGAGGQGGQHAGSGGAGGGASSSSSSSSSASGAGGGASQEDCTNGIDDDGDSLVDCVDPDCTALYACVPAAPNNFQGFAYLRQTGSPGAKSPCDGGGAPAVYYQGPAAPKCSTCGCDLAPGTTCAQATLECWSDAGCLTSNVQVSFNNGCAPVSMALAGACQITELPAPAPNAGCTVAADSQLLNKEQMWNSEVHACTVQAHDGGCDAGMVCAPRPAADYLPSACVYQDGDTACGGVFSKKVLVYAGGDDSRSCGGCSCDPKGIVCEGGGYMLTSDQSCINKAGAIGQLCTPLGLSKGIKAQPVAAKLSAQACQGGIAQGSVAPKDPRTFCCMP